MANDLISQIEPKYILEALEEWVKNPPKKPIQGTDYEVIYYGLSIPPKELIRLAADLNGIPKNLVRNNDGIQFRKILHKILQNTGAVINEKQKSISELGNRILSLLKEHSLKYHFQKGDNEYWAFNPDAKKKFLQGIHYEFLIEEQTKFQLEIHFEDLDFDDSRGTSNLDDELNDFQKIDLGHNWKIKDWKQWKGKRWVFGKSSKLNDPNLNKSVQELIRVFENHNHQLVALNNRMEQKIFNKSFKAANEMRHPLNQILFGPPGTGKTFHTINRALEIIEGKTSEELEKENRIELTKRFKAYQETGQIAFCTFHQSMSYEDFVEGIKPLKPEEGDSFVKYEVVPGIFKTMSTNAAFEFAKGTKSESIRKTFSFSDAFDEYLAYVQEELENEKPIALPTRSGGSIVITEISDRGSLMLKHEHGENHYSITKNRLSKLDLAFPDLAGVKNIDKEFRAVIGGSNASANWASLNAIRTFSVKLQERSENDTVSQNLSFEEKLDLVKQLKKEDYKTTHSKPYVLIIDEINRGNVSQIFGELITLIEDDKRAGKPEALEVVLPYSKDTFSVPPNLYIIGTMNTADRSVEALDTALRRRFVFEEMPPRPEKIDQEHELDIDLPLLLETINSRIEVLLSKDHQIGHSYFMKVYSEEDLKTAFYKSIIPLLQEYFYGDYGKIGLVLGSGFVQRKYKDKNEIKFASFDDGYESGDLESRVVYEILDYRAEGKIGFLEAVKSIYENM